MATIIGNALKYPASIKVRILALSRRFFGQNGFPEATPRMIAKEVDIDISTLQYHWEEKGRRVLAAAVQR
jgi:TetR/AcrR family transcriptional regulator, regulator of cefoperazone and chloramphenicol sensitivity